MDSKSTQSLSKDLVEWYKDSAMILTYFLSSRDKMYKDLSEYQKWYIFKAPSTPHERYGFLPSRMLLGVLEKEGGTSIAGFCVKKFLGRSRTDMDSAGMIG
jgi:hypothetical protein